MLGETVAFRRSSPRLMVFSSITFLFYFLPIVVVLYALTPVRLRNSLLLLASLSFYVWGSGWLVVLLLTSAVIDYLLGFVAHRAATTGDQKLARRVITVSAVANLGMLGWFKYAGWLIGVAADAGIYSGAVPEIALPIGISFFTFQSMSYTIDVARGRCRHLRDPLDFMLFVTFFPQLIAGPIVRFHEIEAQIRQRTVSLDLAGEGALRFAHGLAKKVVVADTIGPIADAAFAADAGSLTTATAWVGVLAYSLQIYFDFSGYSDMAIGLGLIFGFRFPENFARPYSALSFTDFWRRWHITLSNWFRDYVYIPLGGGVGRTTTVYRNLIAVFLLTGVWHGANWTFVAWGAYHGGWLLLERRFEARHLAGSSPRAIAWRIRTAVAVTVGWVFFRADSMTSALAYLGTMFSFDGLGLSALDTSMTARATIVMVAASAVFALPRGFVTGPALASGSGRAADVARIAVMTIALPAALLIVASGRFSAFLYFAF